MLSRYAGLFPVLFRFVAFPVFAIADLHLSPYLPDLQYQFALPRLSPPPVPSLQHARFRRLIKNTFFFLFRWAGACFPFPSKSFEQQLLGRELKSLKFPWPLMVKLMRVSLSAPQRPLLLAYLCLRFVVNVSKDPPLCPFKAQSALIDHFLAKVRLKGVWGFPRTTSITVDFWAHGTGLPPWPPRLCSRSMGPQVEGWRQRGTASLRFYRRFPTFAFPRLP